MLACYDQHHTRLPLSAASSPSRGDGGICLTCLCSAASCMAAADVTASLSSMTASTRHMIDVLSPSVCEAAVQTVVALTRRVCALTRASSAPSSASSLHMAIRECLCRLYLALVVTTPSSSPAAPGEAEGVYDLSQRGMSATLLLLGAESSLLSNPDAMPSVSVPCDGYTGQLSESLVRMLRDVASRSERSEVYTLILILSDITESDGPRKSLCHFIESILNIYTEHIFPLHNEGVVEVFLYWIYKLFHECRAAASSLELLAHHLLTGCTTTDTLNPTSATMSSSSSSFLDILAATLDRFSESIPIINNTLTIWYFLLTLDTTAHILIFSSPEYAIGSVLSRALHYATPHVLCSGSVEVSVLAIEVCHRIISHAAAAGIAIPDYMIETAEDYVLEGLQSATQHTASSLVALANSLANYHTLSVQKTGVTCLNFSKDTLIIHLFTRLASCDEQACEEAVTGSYLQCFFARCTAASSMGDVAAAIANAAATTAVEEDEAAAGATDEVVSLSLYCFLALVERLAVAVAGDVSTIRPETAIALGHRLMHRLAQHRQPDNGASNSGGGGVRVEGVGHASGQLPPMSAALSPRSFSALIHCLQFLLPAASPVLLPIAVHILTEIHLGAVQGVSGLEPVMHDDGVQLSLLKMSMDLCRRVVIRRHTDAAAFSFSSLVGGLEENPDARLQSLIATGLFNTLFALTGHTCSADVETARSELLITLLVEGEGKLSHDDGEEEESSNRSISSPCRPVVSVRGARSLPEALAGLLSVPSCAPLLMYSRVLLTIAKLGIQSEMMLMASPAELVALLERAWLHLCLCLRNAGAATGGGRNGDVDGSGGGAATVMDDMQFHMEPEGGEDALLIAASIETVLSLSAVHWLWFQCVPSFHSLDAGRAAAADACTSTAVDFAVLLQSASVRQSVNSFMTREMQRSDMLLPRVMEELLLHPWSRTLMCYVWVSLVLESFSSKSRTSTTSCKDSSSAEPLWREGSFLALTASKHPQWLRNATTTENGNAHMVLFHAVFHGIALVAKKSMEELGLLRFLSNCLRHLFLLPDHDSNHDVAIISGVDMATEAIALRVIETHLSRYILSQCRFDTEAITSSSAASPCLPLPPVMMAMPSASSGGAAARQHTRVIAEVCALCLMPISPTAACSVDLILMRWAVMCLVADMPGGAVSSLLQLMLILLERSRGQELAGRFALTIGPLLAAVPSCETENEGRKADDEEEEEHEIQREKGTSSVNEEVLTGLLLHRLQSYYQTTKDRPCGLGGVKPSACWHLHVPAVTFAPTATQMEKSLCIAAVYHMLRKSSASHPAAATAAAARFHARKEAEAVGELTPLARQHLHCLLNWCVEAVLLDTTSTPLLASANGLRACRTIYILLCRYCQQLALSQHVLAIYRLCRPRSGVMVQQGPQPSLSDAYRGWLLAALLRVAPFVPWDSKKGSSIYAAAHAFITSLDASLEGSNPAVKPTEDREAATVGREQQQQHHQQAFERCCMQSAMQALLESCQYYESTAGVGAAVIIPKHRIRDFYLSGSKACGDEEPRNTAAVGGDSGECFLVRQPALFSLTFNI